MKLYDGRDLGLLLHEEGMLPPECRNVELLMPADGPLTLRYEVNVTPEDLPKLARAIEKLSKGYQP